MAPTTNPNALPDTDHGTPESQVAPPVPASNVVVLAEDATLLELLKRALDGRQRIWRADDAMHAADLLVAAHSGILFVDVAVTGPETAALVDKLNAQFPDLPIVVAGRRDDELALGKRISSGAVFRFLHKPVSAERVRNFIEAAARRAAPGKPAGAKKAEFGAVAAVRSLRWPKPRIERAAAIRAARAVGLLGLALALLWGVSEVAQRKPWQDVQLPSIAASGGAPVAERQAAVDAAQAELSRLLAAAGIALSQGRLAEPEGDNAVELYRAVLRRDAGNVEARRGLASTADELITRVEHSLLAADLDAAARALDAARSADPTNPRLEFYSAQLERERERIEAAAAAPARNAEAERALAEETGRLLTLADASMKHGRLVGGADTAEGYVLAARQLQPDDPGVRQALNALSGRLLLAATQALAGGDTDAARGWLDRADTLAVDPAAVARLRAEVEAVHVASVQEDLSRLLALANQRIAQGRLVEPASDSARHYVDLLRAAEPGYEGLAETERLLAIGLVDEARRLGNEGRLAEAERTLAQAAAAGARNPELASLRSWLAGLRERAAAADETLPESTLNRTVHRAASYPQRAQERGIEGWVEVEFTVARDGTTRDAVITASEPQRVFDQAVLEAVGAWRYEPHVVAGQPVDQRVQARLRFELADR